MNRIEFGDCREIMKRWKEDGIEAQMCVTSPPYWGLRSYLDDGHSEKRLELGSEETMEAYVKNMVEVFRGVWNVLRDDGVLFLNLADTYSQGRNGRGDYGCRRAGRGNVMPTERRKNPVGIKPKNLLGIPWRVAFALQEDGWNLRQDIIWSKTNPMPASVKDRCTTSHEYIFLLTKSAKYFYDHEAIKETSVYQDKRNGRVGAYQNRAMKNEGDGTTPTATATRETGTRNRRSVWSIPTKGYPDAHFATFPDKLVEPCILAGTSAHGCCVECGSPWKRIVLRAVEITGPKRTHISGGQGNGWEGVPRASLKTKTIGWKATCKCNVTQVAPCLVLDPFMGSGTVAAVSIEHGRKYLGCDINKAYRGMQEKRIEKSYHIHERKRAVLF